MKYIATAVIASAAIASMASAQSLTLTGPSLQTFANGGGSGFGGNLGTGSVGMQISGANLIVSLNAGSLGANGVVVYLDTQSGAITDAAMSDTSDPGRTRVSNPQSGGTVNFPIGADVGIWFFQSGSTNQAVAFNLVSGGALSFLNFNGSGHSVTLPLASIGNPINQIDFFALLTSSTGFLSNESLPASTVNSGGNPGFGGASNFNNFNRYLVPTPGAAALLGLGGLAVARRRR